MASKRHLIKYTPKQKYTLRFLLGSLPMAGTNTMESVGDCKLQNAARPPAPVTFLLGGAEQAGPCSSYTLSPDRLLCGGLALSRGPPLPPPPPPSSFSVWAQAAILLLPRAGVGGLSLLQVRPPAVPPLHGHRPLRTVSPRPLLPTPASLSGCHFRRGARSGGGGGSPGLSVTGGAAGGRHLREGPPAPPPSVGASGPALLPSRSSPRRRVIPRLSVLLLFVIQTVL